MILDFLRYILGFIFKKKLLPKGMNIGKGAWIAPNAILDMQARGKLITIGNYATITNGTRIICHDASSNRRIGATWVAPVTIGDRAYIGAESIILPGVNIGNDVVVAAGSVVTKDIKSGLVVAGVPAKVIGRVEDLDKRRIKDMKHKKIFSNEHYASSRLSKSKINELLMAAQKEGGYFLRNPPKSYRARK